jgi:hypothetical protein
MYLHIVYNKIKEKSNLPSSTIAVVRFSSLIYETSFLISLNFWKPFAFARWVVLIVVLLMWRHVRENKSD